MGQQQQQQQQQVEQLMQLEVAACQTTSSLPRSHTHFVARYRYR